MIRLSGLADRSATDTSRAMVRSHPLKAIVSMTAVIAIVAAGVLLIQGSNTRASGVFAPTVDLTLSTTRATAHPDARIVIDNSASSEDIKKLTIKMPNGFMGSLNAAAPCDYADAVAGSCDADAKIGTVINEAKIDETDSRLRGEVFLTKPCNTGACSSNASTDPAAISIKVPAVVGGVDFGDVIVNARVVPRNGPTSAGDTTGAIGPLLGVDTIVDNVPNSITDDDSSRTVNFDLKRAIIDLRSDQVSPRSPLLTNPSKCASISLSGSAESYDSTSAPLTDAYPETIDQCDTVKFQVSSTELNYVGAGPTPAAGELVGVHSEIELPDDNASLRQVKVKMPSMLSVNYPSFGVSADQCPASSVGSGSPVSNFSPASCPAQAKVGTVSIETPLLADPVHGDVYLIEKSPIPWLGIDVNPSIAGNPKGVTMRMFGVTSTQNSNPGCGVVEVCEPQVVVTFAANLPDAPVKKISMTIDGPNRAGVGGPLSGKILKVADATDAVCEPYDDTDLTVLPHSTSGSTGGAFGIDAQQFDACDPRDIDFAGGPVGAITSDNTPTFLIVSNYVGPGATDCAIDAVITSGESCADPSYTPSTPIATAGPHRIRVAGAPIESRTFIYQPPSSTPDTTAPNTTMSTGPADASTTSDLTPSWTFSSTESSKFQCALDDGAFLPCSSSATFSMSDSYDVSAADEFFPGSDHKFAVRAQDTAGNVDPSPVEIDFDVSVPFDPTFEVSLSTNVARSHPDMDVTITNPSEQDLENTTIRMPNGFMGGLQGVQDLCPVALADAGNCPAGSQVGTINTEALVDETIARIGGKVYLTDSRQTGDAAGLVIQVRAKIQEIDMGDIIVPARLVMRGQAEGVDSMVVGVPKSIDPDNTVDPWDGITEFTMRKMVIKLRTNAAATKPLLTNPSACDSDEFKADFTTYAPHSGSDSISVPFAVAGCEALGFSPELKAAVKRLDGSAVNSEASQPVSLTANLVANADQAGIKDAHIMLPKPLTIDILKLPSPCEIGQEAACPAGSRVGTATATSPLLRPGESLSGPVFVYRNIGKALPRLLVQLRGRISVDIVGTSSFYPEATSTTSSGTQIVTDFKNLPDAPLDAFSMNVDGVLRTTKTPCEHARDFGSSMTGTLTGQNGKTSAVDSALSFDCSGVAESHTARFNGKKSTMKITLQAQGNHAKMKKVKLKLSKRLMFNKRALKRKLIILGDGKRVKSRCYRQIGKDSLEINLCGKSYTTISFNFKAGSLIAPKRLSKASVKVFVSPGLSAKSDTFTIDLKRKKLALSLP